MDSIEPKNQYVCFANIGLFQVLFSNERKLKNKYFQTQILLTNFKKRKKKLNKTYLS